MEYRRSTPLLGPNPGGVCSLMKAIPSFRPIETARLVASLTLATVLVASVFAAARPPEPRRIPLGPLGFETVSAKFLAAGSSLLTVHFVDETHVLVTFAVHRLLPRLADCPPEHDDHTIEAVLVDTAHASVVARTEWRLHDHHKYLWSLGHGVFLLRSGAYLATFAPVAQLESGKPFLAHSILTTDRTVEAVLLSHDRGLLTLETSARRRSDEGKGSAAEAANERAVQLDFFRIHLSGDRWETVKFTHAGVAHARNGVILPNDSNGFVSASSQKDGQWAFDFHEYGGKTRELALFDSSCPPHASLVSSGEFVALACVGGTERKLLAAFNLAGDEMWQQQFYRAYEFPVFEFAPMAGRFALSRILTNNTPAGSTPATPEQVYAQNITVYQTDSGKQLLSLELTPVESAGGNFALSEDGLSLAAVRNDVLELYRLPELTTKDRAAVQKVSAMAPVPSDGPVVVTVSASAAALTQVRALNGGAATTSVSAPTQVNTTATVNGSAEVQADQRVATTASTPEESPKPPSAKASPAAMGDAGPGSAGKAARATDAVQRTGRESLAGADQARVGSPGDRRKKGPEAMQIAPTLRLVRPVPDQFRRRER